mgnify:CR=1 FL=1
MKRPGLGLLAALSLAACTKEGFLKAPDAGDDATENVGSFKSDTHFLIEPSADAEDLLGRAVHVTSKGGWTIADERAPGCSVRVKRSSAEYEKSYKISLNDMTAMSGGYSELLKLEARYGRSVEAAMKIQNVETLTADTEGPCGEVIVKSVRVGTGERRLQRKAEAGASGKLGKGPVAVEGGREGATDIADEIKWSTPQAYAFTYDAPSARKVFEIDVDVPATVENGDRFRVKFKSENDAYLIVYYLDQNGAGTVLFPAEKVPVPMVKGGNTLTLPPKDVVDLQAQLIDPKVGTQDTLIVYAFAERGDFDRFKPEAMGGAQDAVTYAAELTRALSSVPISRWDRHTVSIAIQPKSE